MRQAGVEGLAVSVMTSMCPAPHRSKASLISRRPMPRWQCAGATRRRWCLATDSLPMSALARDFGFRSQPVSQRITGWFAPFDPAIVRYLLHEFAPQALVDKRAGYFVLHRP